MSVALLGGTLKHCVRVRKPHLVIDATHVTAAEGAREALAFVSNNSIHRLNVAGPRTSGEPRGYAFAFDLIAQLLTPMDA